MLIKRRDVTIDFDKDNERFAVSLGIDTSIRPYVFTRDAITYEALSKALLQMRDQVESACVQMGIEAPIVGFVDSNSLIAKFAEDPPRIMFSVGLIMKVCLVTAALFSTQIGPQVMRSRQRGIEHLLKPHDEILTPALCNWVTMSCFDYLALHELMHYASGHLIVKEHYLSSGNTLYTPGLLNQVLE